MKKLLAIVLAVMVLGGLVVGGCSPAAPAPAPSPSPSPSAAPAPAAEEPIELRFAFHVPPGSATNTAYLTPWAEKLEEATGGKVEVTTYPAESLCKSREAFEAVKGGVADMAWMVPGYYEGKFPLTTSMALPFMTLPEGHKDGKTLSDSAVNGIILQTVYETVPEFQEEWSEVKLLFLQVGNATKPVTIDKPISSLDDLQGMKIRQDGGYPNEMWQMLGGSPVFIPLPELYPALEKGVLDGAAVSWAMMLNFKLYEVLQYQTEVPMNAPQLATIMNLDKWNSLSPDIQEAIMSVSGTWGSEFAGATWGGFDLRDEAYKKFADEGHAIESVELDPGEYEKWQETAIPLWDKWIDDMEAKGLPGQKVIDEIQRLEQMYK